MKYAFYLFILFVLCFNLKANEFESFNESPNLTLIQQFLIENSEDMLEQVKIVDKKFIVSDLSACKSVTEQLVKQDFLSLFLNIQKKFPDEELPIKDALDDLEILLMNLKLKKCIVSKIINQKVTTSTYYTDVSDTFHLRVDIIAPR